MTIRSLATMSKTTVVLVVAAMTAATGFASAATAAGPDSDFYSSFESGDPAPAAGEGLGSPTNFTGDRFVTGSVLSLVTTVTGTGSSPDAEAPANLADGSSSSKWLTFAETAAATYELSEPVAISSYTLTSANDAPGRDPRNFTLQGSTDGTTWEDLDSRTGQAWKDGGDENRFVTKSYELAERSDEYAHYRLNITENNGESLIQIADWDLIDDQRPQTLSPMATEVTGGPTSSYTAKTGVGFTGVQSLEYGGKVVADGDASATSVLYELDADVDPQSQLTYKIFPVLDSNLTYAATHVAVDLLFADGSRLSQTEATDAYGFGSGARDQGEGNILWPDQWNSVTVDLTPAVGKTVDAVVLTYDQAGATAGTSVLGYVDDITIEPIPVRDTSDGLISYVDTRRGTNSTGGFSRGNALPATAWPNGFNFVTPMSSAQGVGTMYQYQGANNADNLPGLSGIGISHQPSIWMGDRNQLSVMPAANENPTSNRNDRRLPFRHENEIARPDIYSVQFENGIDTAVTPTDHGMVYRFSFTGDTGSVLVDKVSGDSGLQVSASGAVTGWIDGGSGYPGRTRMFVAGQFDATPTASGATTRGDRNGSARYAAFDTSSDSTVELRLATSFISLDQAKRNLDLEVTGRSFEDIHTDVMAAWNDRLSAVTDVQGATDAQLVTLYSSLYRLNLYPNSQFENTGTAASPVYKYASPVTPTSGSATATTTNASIVDGKIYVNNGFWDTYRTAWPAYALLYPDITEELVDGFVQQYRDGGWVARWSSPGYADLMTGTSSDVSFAEAYLAGALSTDLALEAYDAALKNATVLPTSNAVGRKGLDQSIFLGYTPSNTHQSASWGLEGFINDFGIAKMAEALADDPATPASRVQQLRDEAAYFGTRAQDFALMYNPDAGVFTARDADGSWPVGADFDKKAWGGAFTEASGWTFAFHAPHDVDGMAALYGNRQALLDELHEFLSTPELADHSGIHEAREARDVRLGMLGMSNQVAHHIPYVLAEAGDPSGAQELIREIEQRLFAGSDIGQGYPGDEDNGEMSAWYIFSALGFYPLEVGSGDYTVGSPIFDSATLNLGSGPLTIVADGAASDGDIYVAGLDINGTEITDTTFDGDLVRDGGTMTFTMSATPSDWGAKDLNEDLELPETHVDATSPQYGDFAAADGTAVGALIDDNMRSSVVFDGTEAELTWASSSGPVSVGSYTLTSTDGAGDPAAWTLEGSSDGVTWTEVDSREGEVFPFATQTRPFSVATTSAVFTQFRLTVSTDGADDLGLAQVELFATPAEGAELSVTPAAGHKVRVGADFDGIIATVVGDDFTADSGSVSVDYGDGSAPTNAAMTKNGLGGWTVTAAHTFDRAGVYTVTVTAVDAGGASAEATTEVTVYRDDTLVGTFNNVCIGDLGSVSANCDAQNHGYFRDKLAANGFVQGEVVDIPGTSLSFLLPEVEPGQPDNATGEGQTFYVDLGEGATQLSLIGTATESGKDLKGTITYTDGTDQTIPIQFGDWVGASGSPAFGNILVGMSEGRLSGTSAESTVKNSGIFATEPVTLAVTGGGEPKVVESLTLPAEAGTLRAQGRSHIFAVASDGDLDDVTNLNVEPATVQPQQAGVAFDSTLATFTGGSQEGAVTAIINWADGTAVDTGDVANGTVTGQHAYQEPGTYTAHVTVDDGITSSTTDIEIQVDSGAMPTITVDPLVVRPGEQITVEGADFAPSESVTVTWGTGNETVVTSTASGTFTAQLTAAIDAADGTYPVVALGDVSQQEASVDVRIEAATSGPAATSTTLAGPVSSPVVNESFPLVATVQPAGASGVVEFRDGDVLVGSAPVVAATATLDVRTATSGSHSYTASYVPDEKDKFVASTSNALAIDVLSAPVMNPEVELSSARVQQGDSLTVSGRGFEPGETVTVELHSDPVVLGTTSVSASGTLSMNVEVPRDTAVGEHTVVVLGQQSELVAQASLAVIAADAAAGGDDAPAVDDGAPAANDDGDLATTGASVAWPLAIALALVLAGAVVVGVRHRSRIMRERD